MALYVLIHGAASDGYSWHLLVDRLRALGHEVVAPDLPCEDDGATFDDYADAVVEAIGDRPDPIVVAQSLGAYTGPRVCARVPARLLVLLTPFIPQPGESCAEWFENVDFEGAQTVMAEREGLPDDRDDVVTYLHDVPEDVAADLLAHGERGQSGTPMDAPFPPWPDVPLRVLAGTHDRFFPIELVRRLTRERLGVDPDEIATGHLPALADPDALVERLEAYRSEVGHTGEAPPPVRGPGTPTTS